MQALIDWLVGLMGVIGAPGVGLATALETIFPPVPSEIILPLAGFTANRGRYSFLSALLWATGGSLAGAIALYYAGAAWGLDRLRGIADRLPLLEPRDVDRANAWFQRNGRKAVLVGRLVPGVRSLISIPAGVDRMPILTFVTFTLIGSLGWNALLIGLGHGLGSRWSLVAGYVDTFSTVIYVLLGLVLLVAMIRRIRHRRARAQAR